MIADAYTEWRSDWAAATFGGNDAAKETYKASSWELSKELAT